MARSTKAALAAPNVVVLPTAAPRQVDNLRYAGQRRAARAARQAEPWPGEKLFPGQREAIRKAEVLRNIQQTPALLIVTALMGAMDDDTRRRVIEALAPGVAVGRDVSVQAVAAVQASRLTIGEQLDLDFAFRRLTEEGR